MTVVNTGLQTLIAGPPGKSAYQLAVDNGFVGTMSQWLASLQGAPGTPGINGTDGAAGAAVVSVPQKIAQSTYNIPAGKTYVGITALFAGGCTLTLPAASAYVAGSTLIIADESGACSPTLPINLVAGGAADTIAGLTTEVMETPYQALMLVSNGVNLWTLK